MKKLFLLIIACMSLCGLRAQGLIPVPVEQKISNGIPFSLSSKTRIGYTDPTLAPVASQLAADLQKQTGIKFRIGSFRAGKGDIALVVNANDSQLLQNHPTYGVSAKSAQGVDERYALEITHDNIRITGATKEAVGLACATLRQLVGTTGKKSTEIPTQLIQDAPLYAWRGLSLDVSRSFREVDEVKTILDMMALYKLNVLHLHLSDNQGWRLEVKGYPELTKVGGFVENNGRKGGFYTQEQYQELVSYAENRQITIVPELDLPGHCDAVLKSYPNLKNAASLPVELNMVGQAVVSLDPDDEAAMKLVETAYGQLAALTPGRFIHIGGDETFGMNDEKYTRFIKLVKNYIHERLHKEIVGWQEMARADVGEGDILQNWIRFSKKQIFAQSKSSQQQTQASSVSPELRKILAATYMKAPKDVPAAVENKAKILLSPSCYNYLDTPYEEASVDSAQNKEQQTLGMRSYAPQNLQDMYEWNPMTDSSKLDGTKDVAGVEGAIWAESIVTLRDLQFLVLPRLSGVAEKAWSTAENATWDSYKMRLADQDRLWKQFDWNYFKSSLIDWK